MRTADFDFFLPQHLIAQHPAAERDQSRLLVLDRTTGQIAHRRCFREFRDYLRPGDVLVLNNSRVLPARLRAYKTSGGGEIEMLLLEEVSPNQWWSLLRPGKRVRKGTHLQLHTPSPALSLGAEVLEKNPAGQYRLQFSGTDDIRTLLDQIGEVPLPPYITRPAQREDRDRYQTVFAQTSGSVAAPTAGLHFTPDLLGQIRQQGVEIHEVTLHVGVGTFAPVKVEELADHVMHEEAFSLGAETAQSINAARQAGRRIIAVGTTSVRVLESVAAQNHGRLVGGTGRTRIFIYPPYQFQVVDGLLTNFHLPQSTLLMLVSAFVAPGETRGREQLLAAYAEAVREEYRFFSYGDAMLIL